MIIVPFCAKWTEAVGDLIVPIQRQEFDINITYDGQPDLRDIANFYQHSGGGFWLALDDDELVGTIALKDIGDGDGALRKMFVKKSHRGARIGVSTALLKTLVAHATKTGMNNIYLGTTKDFKAAHRFYEKHGFERIQASDLPQSFPIIDVDTRFYVRRLPKA